MKNIETKVDDSAQIISSKINDWNVKIWSGTRIKESDIKTKVSIGNDTIIEKCIVEDKCTIGRRNIISNSIIGKGTSTQGNTTIRFSEIGKYVAIAWNVSIGAPNHDIHRLAMAELDYIFEEEHEHLKSFDTLECKIGNDVWVAAGAHILRGVSISDGAVIAANAVVTKDVPPYAIVAGVPAKIIGFRFKEEQIKRLLEICWWDFSEEKLKDARNLFREPVTDEIINKLEIIKKGE